MPGTMALIASVVTLLADALLLIGGKAGWADALVGMFDAVAGTLRWTS